MSQSQDYVALPSSPPKSLHRQISAQDEKVLGELDISWQYYSGAGWINDNAVLKTKEVEEVRDIIRRGSKSTRHGQPNAELLQALADSAVDQMQDEQGRFNLGPVTYWGKQQPPWQRRENVVEGSTVSCECAALGGDLVTENWKEATINVREAAFQIVNVVSGYSVLALPYAFSLSGYATAGCLALATLICLYTTHLLGEVLAFIERRGFFNPDYGHVASLLWGPAWGQLLRITCLMECVAYFVNQAVMVGIALEQLWGVPQSAATFCSALFTGLLYPYVDSRALAYMGLGSVLFVATAAVMILISGVAMPEKAESKALLLDDGRGLVTSFSLCIFSVAAHPCWPSTYNAMEAPRIAGNFKKAANIGYAAFFVLFLPFGCFGYWLFGSMADPAGTRNMARDLEMRPLPGFGPLLSLFSLLLLAKLQCALFFSSRPVVEAMVMGVAGGPSHQTPRLRLLIRIGMALIFGIIGGSCAVALGTEVQIVQEATSNLLMSINALIFPAAAFLFTDFESRRSGDRILAKLVVFLGLLMLVAGGAKLGRGLVSTTLAASELSKIDP